MKNLLSITALLAASICFAGSVASERTEITYVPTGQTGSLTGDQDTTMKRQAPMNRKRDMGDTSQVRPDRRSDTTNRNNVPVDSPPGSMPKNKM